MNVFYQLVADVIESSNKSLANTPPTQIIFTTAATVATIQFIYSQYNNPTIFRAYRARHSRNPQQRMIDFIYDQVKNLPVIKQRVDVEVDKMLTSTKSKISQVREQMNLRDRLPMDAVPAAEILREFNIDPNVLAASADANIAVDESQGKDSGALYAAYPDELSQLLKEVYAQTNLSNPMHEKWPRVTAMQAEIIQWTQQLFHGDKEGYGLITHGGTSSIIEAMSAYVLHAKEKGISHPEIVVPETAHAAFKKAASITGATLVIVPVNSNTGAVEAHTMARYLSRNTAVMVGSAPSFMNGISDPINELGALAQKRKIPLHVDACLGGFLTCFLDDIEPMDFRVAGVTSISADTHKYGLCPKGTSVCLFSKDAPVTSVYAALNWAGGLYTTPGLLDGSTSGARVAELYAVMLYFGHKNYKQIAEQIIELRQNIQNKLTQAIDESDSLDSQDIYVFSDPKLSVLGFRSNRLTIHSIADELDKKGWKLNLLQNPNGFHLCLTMVHTLRNGIADEFCDDLLNAIHAVKAYPADKPLSGNVKVYGAVGNLPAELERRICDGYQRARLSLFSESAATAQEPNQSVTQSTGL